MIELINKQGSIILTPSTGGGDTKEAYDRGYKDGYEHGYTTGAQDAAADAYNNGYADGVKDTEAKFADDIQAAYSEGWATGYESGYSQGWESGYMDGEVDGWNDGYQEGMEFGNSLGQQMGYQAGQEEALDNFFSTTNLNPAAGTVDYNALYAGSLWNDTTFQPKYDIKPATQNVTGIFYYSKITDLKKLLNEWGKKLDFLADGNDSRCRYLYNLFAESTITHIPALKFHARNFEGIFKNCKKLHTIDEFDIGGNSSYVYQVFDGCSALENVVFKGTLNCNNMVVSACPLTKESLLSLLGILRDNTGTTNKNSITLGTTNLAKLTDAEKAIATQKGWTLA